MLKVEKVITGFLKENCYIVHDGISCLIIDPGDDEDKIIDVINKNKLIVKGILITHYHFDHVGKIDVLKDVYKDAKIIDYKNLGNVIIDAFKFSVVATYGHTMDSCSFLFDNDKLLFTGDFVFKETIGNYEEDNVEEMIKSFQIFRYINKSTIIYPGHGESTTVDSELKNNPFLKGI
jgi:glyoxylase-like metal-dependent hydrolase (beta-lactamase superfamily II)